jgi:predicted Fe-Mo cluster-binding NifX family protein
MANPTQKYRIVEVKQNNITSYEVQEEKTESDYRESWKVWKLVFQVSSLEEARRRRDSLIASVRTERVVE